MSVPLVFLDTETTGVHPGRKAWEIAMIRRTDSETNSTSFFVGDVDLSEADPFGLAVGHFYERHPQYNGTIRNGQEWESDEPFGGSADYRICTERQAAFRVEEWTRGAHLVGAVPTFDAETLAPMLRYHGLIPAWHYHLIDVEALAVGYLSRKIHENESLGYTDSFPIPMPWKSDELSRACDVEPPGDDERHTALGDARWALRLYDAITGAAS